MRQIRRKNRDPGNWEKVVAIIQVEFRGGEIAAPCACQTDVMIPKGGGTDFWGIGLVEFLWKKISGIINRRILSSIQFHGVLHVFHAGIETGDTNFKANMFQQLIVMREKVLHAIFLDLLKAYDALDR